MAVVDVYALSVDAKGTIAKNRIGTTIKEEYRIVDNAFYNNVPGFMNSLVADSPIYDNVGGHAVQRELELGAPHPGSSNAVLKSISAKRSGSDKQKDGPFVWNVTLEYAPEDEVDKKDTDCKISMSVETNDETDGRTDVEGNLNVNTVGDFFEDKLPLKNKILVIRFQKNFGTNPCGARATASGTALQTMMNCVNSQTLWERLEAGTVLLRSFSCDRNKDSDGVYYWATTIEMAYNPDGWILKKANCGFYDIHGRILDDEGAPVERAKLLDEYGEVDENTSDPYMKEFTLYESAPLHNINIPDPFEDNPELFENGD